MGTTLTRVKSVGEVRHSPAHNLVSPLTQLEALVKYTASIFHGRYQYHHFPNGRDSRDRLFRVHPVELFLG